MNLRYFLRNRTIPASVAFTMDMIRDLSFKPNHIVQIDLDNIENGPAASWSGYKTEMFYNCITDLNEWCDANCKGKFGSVRGLYYFAFEEIEDAVQFKLQWG